MDTSNCNGRVHDWQQEIFRWCIPDGMLLISHTKTGTVQRIDMVEQFMTHNNININTAKSSYHWRGTTKDKAHILYKGGQLVEQGEYGLFTYLGWTTNLLLD